MSDRSFCAVRICNAWAWAQFGGLPFCLPHYADCVVRLKDLEEDYKTHIPHIYRACWADSQEEEQIAVARAIARKATL